MKYYLRTVALLLVAMLLLCSCSHRLAVNENDTYTDRKSGVTYAPLSSCWEPAAIGEEYASFKLSGMRYTLHTVGELDPKDYLASTYGGVYANVTLDVPSFDALELTDLLVYKKSETAIPALTLDTENVDGTQIITDLQTAYLEGTRVSYPSFYPQRAAYTLCFKSANVPGLLYCYSYIEYAEDVYDEIDGVETNLGRYFIYDRYNKICVAVDDSLHALLGGPNA